MSTDSGGGAGGGADPRPTLTVFDWVLVIYAVAWVIFVLLEQVGADTMWLEAVGWVALAVLARPDTNLGRGALVHVAILAVIAGPELAWALWTGDLALAFVDVAYLALAWTLRSDLTEAARPAIEAVTGRCHDERTNP